MMRIKILLFTIFTFLSLHVFSQQILIRTDKSNYKPGEVLKVSMKLKDSSDFEYGKATLWSKTVSISRGSFKLNERTGLFEAEILIPHLVNTEGLHFLSI